MKSTICRNRGCVLVPSLLLCTFLAVLPACSPQGSGGTHLLSFGIVDLGAATDEQPYDETVSVSNGTAPYNCSVSSGALPSGLGLNGSTTGCEIKGTPTATGTSNFTLRVTDSSTPPQSATHSFSIVVNAAPAPTITSLTPSSAVAGSGDLSDTIAGTNLTPDTKINFGSNQLTPSQVASDGSKLTVTIPTADLSAGGTITVTVTTSGGTSNSLPFTVNNPPVITGINPATAIAGQNGFTQTIDGTGFAPGALVTIVSPTSATVATPSNITPTQLTIDFPSFSVSTAGTVDESVTNSGPGGGTSNQEQLIVSDTIKTYSPGPVFPFGDDPSADGSNVMIVTHGPSANVFLFAPTSNVWTQATQLGTGQSVGLSPDGDLAVLGNPSTSPTGSGTATLFAVQNQNWPTGTLTGKALTPPSGPGGPLYGSAVAIGHDSIAVGDPSNAKVWIFTGTGLHSFNVVALTASGFDASSGFGSSVSFTSGKLIVGAPNSATAPGQAFVYLEPSGGWINTNIPAAVLQASDAANGDQEGFSVALSVDGNTAIIGGPGANSGAGAAWVFTNSGLNSWSQKAELQAKSSNAGNVFGTSVSASSDGSTLAVGAPGVSSGQGAVYVFQAPFSGTQNENQLVAPYAGTTIDGGSAVFTSNFGIHVAVSSDGTTIAVGGTGTDSSGTGQPIVGLLQ